MKRRFRLTRSTDFQRVRRIGKTYAHPLVVFIAAPNTLDQIRVGVAAGRSVGSAVYRNRAKRRIRACFEQWLTEIHGGWDLVLLARPAIDQADFQEICAAIRSLLKRASLLND